MKKLLTLALLLASVPAAAIDLPQLKADVQTLSSDEYEGRAPGTPGGDKAVAYIIQRMQALGLKPGNHGSWTQDVPLVAATADPGVTLNIAGGATPLKLDFVKDMVVWTKRQVTQQVLDKAPVVFVGYGINAPEKGWNDYAGMDVHGKTVIILVNDPDWETKAAGKDAGPFEGRTMTYYGRWTYKYEEAMRQGAAAALIIHQTEPAAYPFTVISSTAAAAKLDIDTPDKGMGRVGIEGWLTHDAATRMMAAAGLDLSTLEAAAKVKGFKAVATDLTASAVLNNTLVHSVSKNVVGLLPGAKRPDELVVYSAHWDHLGRCAADATGDDICNGALDNASGVGGMLAIAGDFAKAEPMARSVLFLAVTGEESGLLGSRWYAENPVYPLGMTVGGVNMDGLNLIGKRDALTITGAGKSELEGMATRLAAAQGRKVVPEATPEKGYYFRSDHFSFAKLGVPMLDAGSGGELIGKPAGTAAAMEADYTAKHYHQPSDQYDPNWNWDGAVEDLTLYEQLGQKLADSNLWPHWLRGSEFRAIRDKSRGARP